MVPIGTNLRVNQLRAAILEKKNNNKLSYTSRQPITLSLLDSHRWLRKKGRGSYQDILWGSEKSGNYQIKTFNENIQPANSSKHCAITNRWINNIMIIIISRLPLAWISSIDFLIESMSILLIIYRLTLFVNTIWTAHHLSRITWWVKTVHYLGRLNHAWGWFTKVIQFISTHLQSFLFVTTNWDHVVVVYLTIKKSILWDLDMINNITQ